MTTIDWATGLWVTTLSVVVYLVAGQNAADMVPFAVSLLLVADGYARQRERERKRETLQRRTDALWPNGNAQQTPDHQQQREATIAAGASRAPRGCTLTSYALSMRMAALDAR